MKKIRGSTHSMKMLSGCVIFAIVLVASGVGERRTLPPSPHGDDGRHR
ncbi:MAG: hypothetical protein ACR2KV_17605 [Solirubrobacteraceae bacterium]